MSRIPVLSDLLTAARRIAPFVRRTPLLSAHALDALVGARVFVKAESLQRHGSFKLRGAANAIAAMAPQERTRGVVAFSSGNHAVAVAAAAKLFGAPATIVMPADAPAAKRTQAEALGAEIIGYDREQEDREAIGVGLARERGVPIVRPFDDPLVIAGQGTAGLEISAELAALGLTPDIGLVCASGGGLAAGVAIALQAFAPHAAVYPVEPAGHDDIARSLAAGRRLVNAPGVRSICDALLVEQVGALPFEIGRSRWAGALSVTDSEVAAAMGFAFRHLKLVLEPSGAAALAALLAGRLPVEGKTVVVVASGGNVDADAFAALIARAVG